MTCYLVWITRRDVVKDTYERIRSIESEDGGTWWYEANEAERVRLQAEAAEAERNADYWFGVAIEAAREANERHDTDC